MLLRKTFRFEASHVLPKHPGKCSRLHGHSWVLQIEVDGPINPETGFVMDYYEIGLAAKPVIDTLDHYHLNDIIAYPSSENILHWVGRQLILFKWSRLILKETCTSRAELSRVEFDCVQRGLESATYNQE